MGGVGSLELALESGFVIIERIILKVNQFMLNGLVIVQNYPYSEESFPALQQPYGEVLVSKRFLFPHLFAQLVFYCGNFRFQSS